MEHQRIGSVSNSHVGAEFECVAMEYFAKQKIALTSRFSVDIGLDRKKPHCFDLGTREPKIIVECKSHKWTTGSNVPSAKLTVWNEAMYYFHLSPGEYRKILFVLHDKRAPNGESLLSYYKRTYYHLIPKEVEFLEWDAGTGGIYKA
jgi:hypothetical protein